MLKLFLLKKCKLSSRWSPSNDGRLRDLTLSKIFLSPFGMTSAGFLVAALLEMTAKVYCHFEGGTTVQRTPSERNLKLTEKMSLPAFAGFDMTTLPSFLPKAFLRKNPDFYRLSGINRERNLLEIKSKTIFSNQLSIRIN